MAKQISCRTEKQFRSRQCSREGADKEVGNVSLGADRKEEDRQKNNKATKEKMTKDGQGVEQYTAEAN